MIMEPAITLDQAKQTIAETAKAPRVTEESIKAKIKDVTYFGKGMTTICMIEMQNGFLVLGHSTPASAANYISTVGERYAYDNAFKQLWQLEGYLLRETLSKEGKI
jgi:hypothetical protein